MVDITEKEGQLRFELGDRKTDNQCIMEAVMFALGGAVSVSELARACDIEVREGDRRKISAVHQSQVL